MKINFSEVHSVIYYILSAEKVRKLRITISKDGKITIISIRIIRKSFLRINDGYIVALLSGLMTK